MDFKYLPKIETHAIEQHGNYINHVDRFYRFVDEFNAVGVCWGQPTNISASYFLRLLQEGSSAKARGYSRSFNNHSDTASKELMQFYPYLLDHGALWKLSNGEVICTAFPYGTRDMITDKFSDMVRTFSYPEKLKLQFLSEEYRFRDNGDYFILIYFDQTDDDVNLSCSDDDLRNRAISRSGSRILQRQITSSYVRDRYVSEYVKRRAHGFCQLCGKPAPFLTKDGEPYLETHHVIWLADGGDDSIDNAVALCPNCHRKMHTVNLDEDVKKLLRAASMG